MDDFDYYPDASATWPNGRHYAVPQPDYPPRPANGAVWYPSADERVARGYPPQGARGGPGYPPPGAGAWPVPGYQPGTRPARTASGPMPAYRPDSGPLPEYRQRGGSAGQGSGYWSAGTTLLAGPPVASGQRPSYRPMPSRRPSSDRAGRGDRADGAAPVSPLSIGKRVPGWLPFGNRLVILPKDQVPDEADDELRAHRDVNGGWLRPAVFGAMDGLVTNSSLIAGIGGGGGGHGMIVLTGIAGLIAGAFSTATGEYISVNSQNELTAAEVELERRQHARDPEGKRIRLTEVFMEKGVSPNLAEAVVRQISADQERAVATHVREELGLDPDDLPSPRTAAVASFASFTVGALIPLSPFLVGFPSLNAALVLAGASAFAGGAAVANLTGRPPGLGGLRQFTAAFLATGLAFAIGHLVGAHVS